MNPRNRERIGVRISLAVLVFGLALAFWPVLTQMDGMDGGFGLNVIGGFVSLMSFISWLLYRKRAKVRQRMLTGDALAHWEYPADMRSAIVKEALADTVGLKMMGLILGGIFVAIGIVFVIANEDNAVFATAMAGFGIFFFGVGFLSYSMNRRRLLSDKGEVTITHDGVWYMSELVDFNGTTSILDAVGFHPDEPNTLVFVYRMLSGRPARMVKSVLAIPVPPGEEAQAVVVIQAFGKPLTREMLKKLEAEE